LEGFSVGFLPFVNHLGKRVVRWRRLLLLWLFVTLAAASGGVIIGYALTGDWSDGAFTGIAIGIAFSAGVTVRGLTLPVENLPTETAKTAIVRS
jgi:zinc transporter ZupT